jgi:hypothetical protein
MSYPKSFSDLPFPSKAAYATTLKKYYESKRVYEECCSKTALREQQRSSWCGQIPNELHRQWATEREASKQEEMNLGAIFKQDQIDLNTNKKKLDEEMAVAWKADEPRRISEMEKMKKVNEQRARELEEKKAREAEKNVRELEQKKAREKEEQKRIFDQYRLIKGKDVDLKNIIHFIAWTRIKEKRGYPHVINRGYPCGQWRSVLVFHEFNYLKQNPAIVKAEMPKYVAHLKEKLVEIEREARVRLIEEKHENEVKEAMNRLRFAERARN